MTASQSPRLPVDARSRVRGDTTPVPAGRSEGAASSGVTQPGRVSSLPQAGNAGGDRGLLAGAQTPGPCPHCGNYGPRIVLCHNPDCLHSQSMHALKKGDIRGACSVSTGPKATPCPCREYVPNPESGGG